jgi:uncharacterized protein YbaA (DUF1428 family)
MIDFKLALAQEVAGQIGADVLPERCTSDIGNGIVCDFPRMVKHEQEFPFCWFCVVDKMAAQRGRTALTKAKMASKGIFLIDDHACPMLVNQQLQGERSSWIEGMVA